ncbi:MAG: hypothetical protein C5B51_16910 [Terriglobia bacterium]|nr:MAG: hypothetical protein C5B51_16910 [Terriglobia bacterium]
MKIKTLATAAGALALGLATWMTPSKAQGPMYDTVFVNLPYSVTIGDRTLQPGDYVIKELPSQDKSRVLTIYSDNGMHFETSAMTIPAYEVNTPENTKVVLHHFGTDYYFDKVWIQGKNYGYEFPLPDSVKAREKESLQPVAVAARYEATPPAATTNQTTTAAAQPPAAAAEATPTPAPAPQEPAQIAQSPAPAPAPASPAASPAPEPQANREAPQTLPTTSADWLMMLLGGGSLSGIGLALRRRW